MNNYDYIKEELRKIVTPETVFVCVGTNKVTFDIFGPLCGEILKHNNIPYYGDFNDNVNAITMDRRLHEIYVHDSVRDCNIVAIDAAVTDENEKVNKVVFSNRGVNPGAGLGKRFPMIGDHSILLFTLNRTDLKKTMSYYRKGLSIGKKKDLSNIDVIYEQAKIVTDIIIEVYNEVCKVSI